MTTEELARELYEVMYEPCGFGLKWEELFPDQRNIWMILAAHVQEREKVLREALEKYGGHDKVCRLNYCFDFDTDRVCTCGFATAQQLLKPKE
jgi:hypothetical protein